MIFIFLCCCCFFTIFLKKSTDLKFHILWLVYMCIEDFILMTVFKILLKFRSNYENMARRLTTHFKVKL